MSNSSTPKDRSKTAITRAAGGRFAPGTSAGPGRPRKAETFAEQVRRRCRWPQIIDRLERIVLDEKSRPTDVIAAAHELLDRAWGKPPTDLHITAGGASPLSRDLSAVPLDERRELLAKIRALPYACEPDGSDGGTGEGDEGDGHEHG